jgi:hypothetical protein
LSGLASPLDEVETRPEVVRLSLTGVPERGHTERAFSFYRRTADKWHWDSDALRLVADETIDHRNPTERELVVAAASPS